MSDVKTGRARRLRINRPVELTFVTVGLALIALAAFAPGLLAPGDPLAIDPTSALQPPSLTHPAGTDESGRDVLTRIIHGTRSSAGIGVAAALLGVGLGVVLGFLSGLSGRFVDAAVARVIEVLFALPTLVMALLLVAIMGAGPTTSVLAIGLATAPGYARIVRSRVRSVARSDYVWHAHIEGAHPATILFRHIVPNTLWPLVAMTTLGIGQAIVWVSALSFLGLGSLPPSSEWGAMLNAGRVYISTAWWLTVMPGVAIVLTATALTMLGRRVARQDP